MLLAGRLGEKLDHKIGSYYWARNWAIQVSEMDDPISDPFFPGIWPQSGVKQNWIMNLDQKLDHRFRSTNWVMKLDRKLDHKIGS